MPLAPNGWLFPHYIYIHDAGAINSVWVSPNQSLMTVISDQQYLGFFVS